MRTNLWMALVIFAAPTLAQAGTVAYYRFDNDTTAGLTNDETGLHNGTLVNGPTYSSSIGQSPVNGELNATSLSLNGTNQYVNVPHDSALSFGSSAWTIEAYINLNTLPTTATAGQWIAQKKGSGIDDFQDYGFLVGGNRAGLFGTYGKNTGVTGRELVVELGTGTVGWTSITSTLEVPAAGEWVFVSAAYEPGSSLRFTLDTNLSDSLPGLSETIALPALTQTTNTGALFLGAKANAAGAPAQVVNGLIDEIRISDEVLPLDSLLSVAVPEPSTYVLASIALAALAVFRRRKGR